MRAVTLFFLALAVLSADDTQTASKGNDSTVFKSDVAMTRVDAQVLDRSGRPITGMQLKDFTLHLDGKLVPVRNLASENMPIDILLLLDVSGSMEPHVERIASAAQQALNVLADKDRVAIMVFDTSTRVRLPFRNNHDAVTKELNHLLRSEGFNRGTRITHAMLDAASYLGREARPEARRAIVVLTDDQTQDDEDERRVDAALARANAVLSFLQAPYEPPDMGGPGGSGGGGQRRGTWGSGGGGGSWPGGGGIGFPGGGGIGFPGGGSGRRGGYGGGGDPSHTAGTADIARDSGGDTMQVDEASALEDTLARLRQRYALYFYVPEGVSTSDPGSVKVDLSEQGRVQFGEAEIRYRRVYMSGTGAKETTGAAEVTRVHTPATSIDDATPVHSDRPASSTTRRRAAVSDDSSPVVNTVEPDADSSSESKPSVPAISPSSTPTPQSEGWPQAKPQ